MPRQRGLVGSVAWGLAVAGCQFGSGSGATEGLAQTTGAASESATRGAGPTTNNADTGNADPGNANTSNANTSNADTVDADTNGPDTGAPTSSTGPSAETDSSGTGFSAMWADGYGYRKQILIQPQTDLDDFPVGIIIDSDPDLAQYAAADGSDLRLTGEDGVAELPFEVEFYNAGSTAIWVNAGPLTAREPTPVYLYYGNPAPPPMPPPSQTWPERFDGVWHMDLSDAVATDSSAAGHDAQPQGPGPAGAPADGIVGPAAQFVAAGSQSVPDAGGEGLDYGAKDSLTVSMWVRVTQSAGLYDSPLHKGAAGIGSEGYGFFLGTGNWTAWAADLGTGFVGGVLGEEEDFLDEWAHLVLTVDRDAGEVRLYANGELAATDDASSLGSLSSAIDLSLSWSINPFAGTLDEVRVERAPVDLARVRAAYRNVTEPSQLYTVGEQETP